MTLEEKVEKLTERLEIVEKVLKNVGEMAEPEYNLGDPPW